METNMNARMNDWTYYRYSYLEGNSEDPSNMRTVSFTTFDCRLAPGWSKVRCDECDWYSSAFDKGNLSAPGESHGAEHIHEEMRVHGNEHFVKDGWPIHEQ